MEKRGLSPFFYDDVLISWILIISVGSFYK